MEGHGASVRVPAAAVFQLGKLTVDVFEVEESGSSSSASSPPKPLLIVAPSDGGHYPVLLFLHGFGVRNLYYSQLLRHVASHGFIVVAPQLYITQQFWSQDDIHSAAAVTDWLASGLQSLLPKAVQPNLDKLALAGHSKGGHASFSLALGHAKTALKFSLLVGIDPGAGACPILQVPPRILTYKPASFDLDIPVMVVGTGLSDQRKSLLKPPCSPKGVNHKEFFYECRPPCCYFVVRDYGHMDMMDDDAPKKMVCQCKSGEGCRDLMRRCTAGLVLAFMKAYLNGEGGDLRAIVDEPGIAPAVLSPVCFREM